MNVAKYLNGDWQPDWNNRSEIKYYISLYGGINIYRTTDFHCLDIYFKSKELAEQAVGILGKETIRLALCTDW